MARERVRAHGGAMLGFDRITFDPHVMGGRACIRGMRVTVAFLHPLGHDAVHLSEQGLERLPDPSMVEKAREEGRIVLVHDLGFGELVAASGATLPSVITFRLRNRHPDRVNGALQNILSQHSEALEQGR